MSRLAACISLYTVRHQVDFGGNSDRLLNQEEDGVLPQQIELTLSGNLVTAAGGKNWMFLRNVVLIWRKTNTNNTTLITVGRGQQHHPHFFLISHGRKCPGSVPARVLKRAGVQTTGRYQFSEIVPQQ